MAEERKLRAVKGFVKQIMFSNPTTSYYVFKITTKKRLGRVFTCAGVVNDAILPGTLIEVFGYFEQNSKYGGEQIKITSTTVMCGNDSVSIAKYLMGIAKFLGEEKSMAIANYFGQSLEDVLENDPERLREVDGIGEGIYKNIMAGWSESQATRGVKIFLIKMGMPDRLIQQVIQKHGSGYEEVLKQNPYVLLNDGLDFSACESLAERLKVDPKSENRFRGLIRHLTKSEAYRSGHMYISMQQLNSAVNNYNSELSDARKLDEDGVSSTEILNHANWLVENGYIIIDGDAVYDVGAYYTEASAAKSLARILTEAAAKTFGTVNPEKFIATYEAEEAISMSIPNFKLSDQQREAIEAFIREKVIIVTGAPGTGKTTILKSFVKILRGSKIRFELFAPTGAASKRLAHTAKHEASTIHRGLGAKISGEWAHGQNCKLETDCVIVDEFSMVDTNLLSRLLSALKPSAKLVMVGDVYQLPSVGAGYVLHDLIASGKVHTIKLEKVQRQSEASNIVKLANAIKDGVLDMSCISNSTQDDVSFIRTGSNYSEAEKHIKGIAKMLTAKKQPGLFQVITPRNEGPLSVSSLNELLQEELNPKLTADAKEITLDRGVVIRKGDRILITKNNYNLNVFNGDTGKVMGISSTDLLVAIEGPDGMGETIPIPLPLVKEMVKLGFGLTVHKCMSVRTPIRVPGGTKLLGDVKVGDLVISGKGNIKPVTEVSPRTKKPSILIGTRECAPYAYSEDHLLRVYANGLEGWMRARDIRVGYRLVGHQKKFLDFETPLPVNTGGIDPHTFLYIAGYIFSKGAPKLSGICGRMQVRDGFTSIRKFSEYLTGNGVKHTTHGIGRWHHILKIDDKSLDSALYLAFKGYSASWLYSSGEKFLSSFIGGVRARSKAYKSSYRLVTEFKPAIQFVSNCAEALTLKRTTSHLSGLQNETHTPIPGNGFLQSGWDSVPTDHPHVKSLRKIIGDNNLKLLSPIRELGPLILRSKLVSILSSVHGEGVIVPEEIKDFVNGDETYSLVSTVAAGPDLEMCDIGVEQDKSFTLGNGTIVHNCQGSEYKVVLIPLVKSHGSNLLQRNLVYTALTRAKKKVIFFGEMSALDSAVQNNEIQKRNTNLSVYINQALDGTFDPIERLASIKSDKENYSYVNQLLFPKVEEKKESFSDFVPKTDAKNFFDNYK